MATLVARGVTASYAASPVLFGVDVTVGPGSRIGLVGPNGAGKSTLLRVLAGELAPEAGTVSATGTVGYLPQEPDRQPEESLLGYLGRRSGVTAAATALHGATEALERGADGADQAYPAALEHWLAIGGADFEVRAAAVTAELGLAAGLLGAGTAALSGGQLARAGLAAVLLSRQDVLLLDEPTNNLDLDGLELLERFVLGLRGGFVLVSHDREFLARTVSGILELDPHNRRSSAFAGGWEAYLRERQVARRHDRERYEAFADRRDGLAGQVQATREMSVRGAVRAKRRAPDADRAARGARLEAATSAAAKVRSLETRLRRLEGEQVAEPRKEWQLQLTLPAAPRSGDSVATLRAATVRRGEFTLGPVDLDVRWADRVGVLGANGSGKSTLLALLLGELAPDSGTAALGAGVLPGRLDQARDHFADDRDVATTLAAAADLSPAAARTLLAKFGLRAAHLARPARSLSPGERTRAGLALLMAAGTNLLVLDEPTNHLDLPAIEQLEAALCAYRGTLLLVTHDRRLLSAVPLTRTLRLPLGPGA